MSAFSLFGPMTTKFDASTLTASVDTGFATALTFDDVLLVPQH